MDVCALFGILIAIIAIGFRKEVEGKKDVPILLIGKSKFESVQYRLDLHREVI